MNKTFIDIYAYAGENVEQAQSTIKLSRCHKKNKKTRDQRAVGKKTGPAVNH